MINLTEKQYSSHNKLQIDGTNCYLLFLSPLQTSTSLKYYFKKDIRKIKSLKKFYYISYVFVPKSRRGNGYATFLLTFFIRQLVRRVPTYIELSRCKDEQGEVLINTLKRLKFKKVYEMNKSIGMLKTC